MRRVDARAPQFGHAWTQEIQAGEVEFLLGVIAADAAGRLGREDAVGADDFAAGELAHQQVVAEGVVEVDIVARQGGRQAGTHLFGEDPVAQALRLADLAVVDRQRNMVAAGRCGLDILADIEHGALPWMEGAQLRRRLLSRRDGGIAGR